MAKFRSPLQGEVWKPVKGYKHYEVSNQGRVRNRFGMILKEMDNGKGYKSVVLTGQKRVYVHRLVADNFLNNDKNYREVNHKDGIKDNNDVSNLEWCSRKHNNIHAFKVGLKNHKGENAPWNKLTEKDVRKIFLARNCGIKSGELQRMFNVSDECIRSIYKGINWKHLKLSEHIV